MSVLRIAHRGGAATRPENTLSAFANAIALGADGAELDVQLTRDGQVVVFHDFCLKPDLCRDTEGNWLTSNGPRIADLGREEIAGYDVGRARPGSEYALQHPDLIACDGARIPLLAEIVALARRASQTFSLFVELKTSLAGLSASPENLAEATLAVLRESDYLDQCVIVGFDWRGLRRAKEIEPSTACWFSTRPQSWFRDGQPPPEDDPPAPPVLEALRNWARSGTSPWADGFDAVGFGGSIVEAVKAAGADGWFPYAADATREAIARAHNLGLRVGAWTVDEREQMNALIGNGIDAICTDREDFFADHARN